MCTFEDLELEEGDITRVQEYSPGYMLCGFHYIGKITIVEDGERYLGYIVPSTIIYKRDNNVIPNDKIVERITLGSECEYLFKERIKTNRKPNRIVGIIEQLWLK
jgi:hypothetical protein